MISHYKIIEKIGAGGMGEVYLAEDTELNRKVALKFLPPHLCQDEDCRARFKREAQAAAALEHPNIVTIYEVNEYEGRPYIVMQYVEGNSLRELIKGKELSLDRVVDLAIQICEGLQEAHAAGIVHRDIKPSNILISKSGRPKVVDFGLATIQGAEKLTRTGFTPGTIGYMSPEQVQGKEAEQRSDIFSLGVVLYEMIAGRPPFKRDTEAATLNSILNDAPEPLARYKSEVPQELQQTIDKALNKGLETRYQTTAGMLADLKRVKKVMESTASTRLLAISQKRAIKRFLVPASAVAIIILLLLVLKPWKIEVQPTHEVVAAENRLAIMYFENLADPNDEDRIAEMITSLLITDLSESQYMQVMSRQRLYDILRLLGKEDLKVIDKTVASEVAEKARVKWILTGDILRIDPNIVLTSDISERATGKILATQRVAGEMGEDLFAVVDKLSAQVKEDLSLPKGATEELDRPVADVTTQSPEAYRYYLEGLDHYNRLYWFEAARSFKRALEHDSTFAMAYLRLSMLIDVVTPEEKTRWIAKAVEYSDKVSRKEKNWIESMEPLILEDYAGAIEQLLKITERDPEDKEALFWIALIYRFYIKDPEQAVRYFNKAIEIDPLYKRAYNQLTYAYDQIGDFEKSLWAINQYISLAPDEPNPYDTRGELYAANGKIDQAIKSYKKALEIEPDFYYTLRNLGDVYLYKRKYAKAESCYQALCSSSERDWRSAARTRLACIPVYQGKLETALEVLDDGLAADRMEKVEGWRNIDKHFMKAFVYEEKENLTSALREAQKVVEASRRIYPDDRVYDRHYYVQLLSENGEFARAAEVAQALKTDIEENNPSLIDFYWYAVGSVEFSRGNFQAAANHFAKAVERLRDRRSAHYFQNHFMLARAYLQSGRFGEAVANFERLLSIYSSGRLLFTISCVKTHYYLGLAYEKSGWNNKAMEQYQEFLNIWKDADPGIADVEDARDRLGKLSAES